MLELRMHDESHCIPHIRVRAHKYMYVMYIYQRQPWSIFHDRFRIVDDFFCLFFSLLLRYVPIYFNF